MDPKHKEQIEAWKKKKEEIEQKQKEMAEKIKAKARSGGNNVSKILDLKNSK